MKVEDLIKIFPFNDKQIFRVKAFFDDCETLEVTLNRYEAVKNWDIEYWEIFTNEKHPDVFFISVMIKGGRLAKNSSFSTWFID
jgi:hypothetical protein